MVLTADELREAWRLLSAEERSEGFRLLDRDDAEELFDQLDARDQLSLILSLRDNQRRWWMRYLDPDDAADVVQEADEEEREALLALLDESTRKEVAALLAYKEDEAGGLMNPRYARLRPDMSVDAAISYLRRQTRENIETIYYTYVFDADQRLVGVVSLRDLMMAPPGRLVRDVMETDLVTVTDETDQEVLSNMFARHDLMAIPVVDDDGRMKGIVTVDDIVDVFREEATEDMHKMGGTEALEEPYLQIGLMGLLKKRVVWLAILLVLGFFTVLAMRGNSATLAEMRFLAFFVPMIIASGGNSGSQASTLVVRAIALGEVRPRDWWRVIRREVWVGLALGATLAALAYVGVEIWLAFDSSIAGEHVRLAGLTVAVSILAVALWGSLVGTTLPLALRALGLDPASASAPLVATLIDATGLMIYFTTAALIIDLPDG
ncbi:MAG: magnesium transporter [Planctomycetota bacterium]|nr:MAG: magnesium transporter [Planctomycetota bacterium]